VPANWALRRLSSRGLLSDVEKWECDVAEAAASESQSSVVVSSTSTDLLNGTDNHSLSE